MSLSREKMLLPARLITAQDLPKVAKQKTLAWLLWYHPLLLNEPGKICQTITGLKISCPTPPPPFLPPPIHSSLLRRVS